MPVTLRETGARLGEQTAQPSRRRVTIINAGWGSSGYYSRELLERDGAKTFPVGTQMFLDHPGRTEESDRPERSVRDLAARIATTPVMAGSELVAEAEVFEVWRPVIDSIASDIGLSIRALGETEHGEAEGRQGPIVTALTEGISVDFVTKAGAGGKVGELIESARTAAADDPVIKASRLSEARNAGNWFEAKIHASFTEVADGMFGNGYLTREERIALSSAIGDALTAFNEAVAENAPGLYQRDPYADPDRAGTQVTEAAAGRPTKEANMADNDRLAALEESVGKIQTTLAETERKLGEAETARDRATQRADRAEEALLDIRAEKLVREATITVEGSKDPVSVFEGLRPTAVERAVKAVLAEKLPVGDDGKLDADKLAERATKAAKAERDYLAENGAGAGRVTGFGPSRPADATEVDDKQLTEAFGRLGMSETGAKLAANGR
jgi:hypothetical protein